MIHSILLDQNNHFRSYLGRYLRQKRQSVELTLKEVAQHVGISEASYRRLESGGSKITYENLEVLFSILPLDLQELLEISRISKIACANDIAKELSENYPQ